MPVSDFKPAPVVSRSAKSKNSKEENNPASADANEHSPELPVDLEQSDFGAEAETDSENEFSDIVSYSDRLHRAMAAVDIQLALEDLDREESQLGARSAMPPDPDDDLALEELLFRELSDESETPVAETPVAEKASTEQVDNESSEDNDEQDAMVGLATLHVERACRDVIDEAKSDALMQRIVRQRKEAMNLAVTSEDTPDSDPEYDVELPDVEARNSFATAFTARRLSYATAAVAILAVGVYASSNINSLAIFNGVSIGQDSNAISTTASMSAVPNTVLVSRTVEPAPTPIAESDPAATPAPVVETSTVVKQATTAVQSNPSRVLAAPVKEEVTIPAATSADPVKDSTIATTERSAETLEKSASLAKSNSPAKAKQVVRLVDDPQIKQPAANSAANAVQAVNSVAPVADAPNIKYSNSYAATEEAGSKNFNANQGWNKNLSARMGTESQPTSDQPKQATSLGEARNQDTLTAEDRRLAALPDDPPLLVPKNKLGNPDRSLQPLPRSEQAVEQALSQSLGLDGMGRQARADLKGRLVAGECLSTALSEVLGQVPIVAMRDLILSLDSEC